MENPKRLYELLLDYCRCDDVVANMMIGLVWTLCESGHSRTIGLAMSPGIATRTLSWSGTLAGKPLTDIAAWILSWDPYQATVAMAAINSSLNSQPFPNSVVVEQSGEQANLAVFEYFLPQLHNKNVVVIGHYPGIERYQPLMQLTVLEKQPSSGDLPDSACEFLLANADWVFLTGSSIINKTFPRLAELATTAKTVLMGPTVPWLPQLHEFGINFLAGVEIVEPRILYQTIAEGGGRRIFEQAVRYRIAELTPATSMHWQKQQIADAISEKNRLTFAMENWYAAGHANRFPDYPLLDHVNNRLSRLDSSYKLLWDEYHDTHEQVY